MTRSRQLLLFTSSGNDGIEPPLRATFPKPKIHLLYAGATVSGSLGKLNPGRLIGGQDRSSSESTIYLQLVIEKG